MNNEQIQEENAQVMLIAANIPRALHEIRGAIQLLTDATLRIEARIDSEIPAPETASDDTIEESVGMSFEGAKAYAIGALEDGPKSIALLRLKMLDEGWNEDHVVAAEHHLWSNPRLVMVKDEGGGSLWRLSEFEPMPEEDAVPGRSLEDGKSFVMQSVHDGPKEIRRMRESLRDEGWGEEVVNDIFDALWGEVKITTTTGKGGELFYIPYGPNKPDGFGDKPGLPVFTAIMRCLQVAPREITAFIEWIKDEGYDRNEVEKAIEDGFKSGDILKEEADDGAVVISLYKDLAPMRNGSIRETIVEILEKRGASTTGGGSVNMEVLANTVIGMGNAFSTVREVIADMRLKREILVSVRGGCEFVILPGNPLVPLRDLVIQTLGIGPSELGVLKQWLIDRRYDETTVQDCIRELIVSGEVKVVPGTNAAGSPTETVSLRDDPRGLPREERAVALLPPLRDRIIEDLKTDPRALQAFKNDLVMSGYDMEKVGEEIADLLYKGVLTVKIERDCFANNTRILSLIKEEPR